MDRNRIVGKVDLSMIFSLRYTYCLRGTDWANTHRRQETLNDLLLVVVEEDSLHHPVDRLEETPELSVLSSVSETICRSKVEELWKHQDSLQEALALALGLLLPVVLVVEV